MHTNDIGERDLKFRPEDRAEIVQALYDYKRLCIDLQYAPEVNPREGGDPDYGKNLTEVFEMISKLETALRFIDMEPDTRQEYIRQELYSIEHLEGTVKRFREIRGQNIYPDQPALEIALVRRLNANRHWYKVITANS
jgi:hypothetical protein